MKKFSLRKTVLLFIGLFFVTNCASLKVKKENIPDKKAVLELIKILDKVDYKRKTKLGFFDCSNQSALLYDLLTQKGYKCKIMVGAKFVIDDESHAWIVAEKDKKVFFVEPTLKRIANPHYYEKFIIRVQFETLKEVRELFSTFGFSDEWEY
ncbi:hypothetical protein KKA27_04310 [Patescibacteria group bacterium]|nr:hypothetical protein [Patescibacteria group bacterium]MBU2633095.1 hypothetical protein [Patescibacteria group bacterium]